MKTTIGNIYNGYQSLIGILNEPLNPKDAFDLMNLMLEMEKVINSNDNIKMEIAKRYGVPEGDGFSIPNEKAPQFSKEIDALMSKEIEIAYEPINFNCFNNIKLSITQVKNILHFFKKD